MESANKVKPPFLSLIFLTFSILGPGYMVLSSQKLKRQQKIQNEMSYLNSVQSQSSAVYAQIQEDIKMQKEKNKADMEAAKKTYEQLLARQPAILEQHKVQVAQTVGENVVTKTSNNSKSSSNSNNSSNSSNSSSSSQKKTVSKPKISRPTQTS